MTNNCDLYGTEDGGSHHDALMLYK